MTIQIDTRSIEATDLNSLLTPGFRQIQDENKQLLDQVRMLEMEVDRQSTIIDALIKAIKVIERG